MNCLQIAAATFSKERIQTTQPFRFLPTRVVSKSPQGSSSRKKRWNIANDYAEGAENGKSNSHDIISGGGGVGTRAVETFSFIKAAVSVNVISMEESDDEEDALSSIMVLL